MRGVVAGLVLSTAGILGCGGGGSSTPTGAKRVISVGGDYDMAVALSANDCGSVVVMPLPTHVDHVPGSGRFVLTHGGASYDGNLSPDGTFVTDPRRLADPSGATLTVAITGRFSTGGLQATVTVTMERPTGTCHYVVQWTGTKRGAANTIP